jgi:hypothetical protein
MSFGKHTSWRLWSPLIALLWVIATVGFARAATADPAADPGPSRGGEHRSDIATTHQAEAGHLPTQRASGDTSSPQPISNADANSGGANGQCPGGPYCSTRDGSPSANGNGGGQAIGKPCAGCVGKADNKNPRGQMPNGSDANAGYECDTNHGIGRTNPAHTGCTTPEQECVPTEGHPCVPTPPCVPSEGHPCVPTPPCESTPSTPCVPSPDCVPTESVPCAPQSVDVSAPGNNAGSPSGAVVSPAVVPATAQALPNTGAPADLVWLASAALASLLIGTGLVLRPRQRGRHLAR